MHFDVEYCCDRCSQLKFLLANRSLRSSNGFHGQLLQLMISRPRPTSLQAPRYHKEDAFAAHILMKRVHEEATKSEWSL